jgi:hypothetical protein
MRRTLPIQRDSNPATETLMPSMDDTPHLSARTLGWLASRPYARLVVYSVWDTLAELERAGHHPRLLAAVRFVLVHHEPSRGGRCRACRRVSWRGLWRRRRFPCVVWRQIRGELLGHLYISGPHHRRADSGNARDRHDALDDISTGFLRGCPAVSWGPSGHIVRSGSRSSMPMATTPRASRSGG